MTEFPEDYELFHYGVKGMKWGVRRKRDSTPFKRANLDFSKSRTARSQMDRADNAAYGALKRIEKVNEKKIAEAQSRVDSATRRKDRKAAEKNLDRVVGEETRRYGDAEDRIAERVNANTKKYHGALKEDRARNRAAMDAAYMANGGQKRSAGKMYVDALKAPGGGMQVGMREAMQYGATRGQAAAAAFVAGPYAGKAYREAVLVKEQYRNTRNK